MPKIKVKLTPTQARILRALNENCGLLLGWPEGGRSAWWSGNNEAEIRRELGNPRNATMKKLKDEGWIMPAIGQTLYWMSSDVGSAAVEDLTADDFTSPPPNITAREIIAILKAQAFPAPFWMFVEELAVNGRRVDAFALKVSTGSLYPDKRTPGITGSRLLTSWSLEIKVSRSDFLSDIAHPPKQYRAREICNRFAYVAPVGLIQKEELPAGCGLLEIHKSGSRYRVSMTVEPEYEIAEPASWSLVASIARAMMK